MFEFCRPSLWLFNVPKLVIDRVGETFLENQIDLLGKKKKTHTHIVVVLSSASEGRTASLRDRGSERPRVKELPLSAVTVLYKVFY